MIVFHMADLLTEAEGTGDLQLHLRAVIRIPAPALRFPENRHGKSIFPHHFLNILTDAVLVAKFFLFELFAHLIAEFEGNALVYHRLAAQYIPVIIHRDVDIGEHLLVRPPMKPRAGLFAPVGGFFFQTALVATLFKMQIVPEAVPADGGIKEFRRVLGGTGAKAVQAQRILVVLTVLAILAAGVHLTEHQLPVVALFFFVVVHGTAAAKVLHFHAEVLVAGHKDGIAVPLSCLVDGVGENFKYRVLAAFQIVRTEDDRRTLANPVLSLEHGNTGVSVLFLFFSSHNVYLPYLSILSIILYPISPVKSTVQTICGSFTKKYHYLLWVVVFSMSFSEIPVC